MVAVHPGTGEDPRGVVREDHFQGGEERGVDASRPLFRGRLVGSRVHLAPLSIPLLHSRPTVLWPWFRHPSLFPLVPNMMERGSQVRLGPMLLVALLSAIFGGVISNILRHLIPGGILHDLFVQGVEVGMAPPLSLNLAIFHITFGFTLDLSLLAILCAVIGLLVYRKVS
ncbi:MAG: hypothetical protein COZ96_01085 [Nitrospirae bacterium CG_4_8_14_3_um_filter_70_85]|nr:MAG: hypothetical protein COS73_11195 [Nitrospirae bacterium CG06_land_8_20_14_3_00_70_43]PIW83911.1 MAG: hypothetical protein COZ96_01085 [Nitrospirae bacterium CG_4_8_14_3_um_filter_70_85]PIX82823.1 MAG: hypothetical protein COZ33_08845 [Nitrospirae bacterium CG_4_10_14_3_um_filter_70_108]